MTVLRHTLQRGCQAGGIQGSGIRNASSQSDEQVEIRADCEA